MERDGVDWRKSTFSGNNGGQCVEVATSQTGILVRDTANRTGTMLALPASAWRSLLAEVRGSQR